MFNESNLMPMGKLRWRCRRGMRELDVLLIKFLELRYADLDQANKELFEAVLELQDPDLYAMLTGKLVSDSPEVRSMIAQFIDVANEQLIVG